MKNKISEFLKSQERPNFPFVPNAEFYKKTGINRIRWAKLIKKEREPLMSEISALAEYFNISIDPLIY